MKSPLPYFGGKSRLAQTIIEMMPEHKTYAEVFAGAGWVFFGKPPSKYEILNDLDGDLVAFFRVVQNHLEEFLRQFRWLLSSREVFLDWREQLEGRGLTDIQRAARYYYLQRQAFAGRPRKPSFGPNPLQRPRINLLRIEEELSEVHLRLAGVTVENLDWKAFVERYDRPEVFFYLDPPYWGHKEYKHNLDAAEYAVVAELLSGIAGKFILSIDDRPETREVFGGFSIQEVRVRYTASGKSNAKAGGELLVANFRAPRG